MYIVHAVRKWRPARSVAIGNAENEAKDGEMRELRLTRYSEWSWIAGRPLTFAPQPRYAHRRMLYLCPSCLRVRRQGANRIKPIWTRNPLA
jgi:hypothetical protein